MNVGVARVHVSHSARWEQTNDWTHSMIAQYRSAKLFVKSIPYDAAALAAAFKASADEEAEPPRPHAIRALPCDARGEERSDGRVRKMHSLVSSSLAVKVAALAQLKTTYFAIATSGSAHRHILENLWPNSMANSDIASSSAMCSSDNLSRAPKATK